ncbi:MAG: TadE/TadG family type IV pilus assembly protein [Propionibacteriaceae bacterium]
MNTLPRVGAAPSRDERGSAAVELVIVVPALIMILGLLITGARIQLARTVVTEAAYSAARAASLARSPALAQQDAMTAAGLALQSGSVTCTSTATTVDLAEFVVPVGQPADVRASVSCTVSLADVVLPGMPGRLVLDADGTAPLDTYRER